MSETAQPLRRRIWRKEERVKVSILHVFRAAAEERRRLKPSEHRDEEERLLALKQRQAMNENQLRAHLQTELAALLNTIRLDAVVGLDDTPHVARSIVNYGFRDFSGMGASELDSPKIIESIRQSLVDHEPRLVPSSIDVRVVRPDAQTNSRLRVSVEAEIMGDPVDIPLDFSAEVDLGAGRLSMSRLKVQL